MTDNSPRWPNPLAGPPSARTTYRIDRSFEWNAVHGPDYTGPWPEVPQSEPKRFLGLEVGSRFGVPASVLTSHRWVETYARLGFDILTYKTVRSRSRQCLPAPNWWFLDPATAELVASPDVPQVVAPTAPLDPVLATGVGSFGIPSTDPEFWTDDIGRSRAALGRGQVLIVSVVATVRPDDDEAQIIGEFEELASRVRAAGADAVEANLSCPNVGRSEGEVYRDPELAGRVADAVRRGADGAPVIVKIGPLEERELLQSLLRELDGRADAVAMTNAASRRIVKPDGSPAFGAGRERAGVVGGRLHDVALAAVRSAAEVIERDGLGLEVIGIGGASTPARIQGFLDAGACAVQSASGATWNPHLAVDARAALPHL
jgi:hypothetical protein